MIFLGHPKKGQIWFFFIGFVTIGPRKKRYNSIQIELIFPKEFLDFKELFWPPKAHKIAALEKIILTTLLQNQK